MANKSRQVTRQVIELAEESIIDWESLARNCLAWMSEHEVQEFARIHGYAEDTLE